MRTLVDNVHFRLTKENADVYRLTRSAAEFESAAALVATHDELAMAFSAVPKNRSRILVDLRHAPSRNDEAFEALMKEQLPRLYRGWERLAVVVATSIGRLHIERHMRSHFFEGRAFENADAALTYLS